MEPMKRRITTAIRSIATLAQQEVNTGRSPACAVLYSSNLATGHNASVGDARDSFGSTNEALKFSYKRTHNLI